MVDRVVVRPGRTVKSSQDWFSHLEYRIEVVGKNGKAWSVNKRYTDFENLFASLKNAEKRLPSLPTKNTGVLGFSCGRSEFVADERQAAFQQLLDYCLHHNMLKTNTVLLSFLRVPKTLVADELSEKFQPKTEEAPFPKEPQVEEKQGREGKAEEVDQEQKENFEEPQPTIESSLGNTKLVWLILVACLLSMVAIWNGHKSPTRNTKMSRLNGTTSVELEPLVELEFIEKEKEPGVDDVEVDALIEEQKEEGTQSRPSFLPIIALSLGVVAMLFFPRKQKTEQNEEPLLSPTSAARANQDLDKFAESCFWIKEHSEQVLESLSTKERFELYGLFKRATQGKAPETTDMNDSKLAAWSKYNHLAAGEARKEYIDLVAEIRQGGKLKSNPTPPLPAKETEEEEREEEEEELKESEVLQQDRETKLVVGKEEKKPHLVEQRKWAQARVLLLLIVSSLALRPRFLFQMIRLIQRR